MVRITPENYTNAIDTICDNEMARIITGVAFAGFSLLTGLLSYTFLVIIPKAKTKEINHEDVYYADNVLKED